MTGCADFWEFLSARGGSAGPEHVQQDYQPVAPVCICTLACACASRREREKEKEHKYQPVARERMDTRVGAVCPVGALNVSGVRHIHRFDSTPGGGDNHRFVQIFITHPVSWFGVEWVWSHKTNQSRETRRRSPQLQVETSSRNHTHTNICDVNVPEA